jgi:hypothetical protein
MSTTNMHSPRTTLPSTSTSFRQSLAHADWRDLPPIRVPGDFLVSQGLAGDGLRNTLAGAPDWKARITQDLARPTGEDGDGDDEGSDMDMELPDNDDPLLAAWSEDGKRKAMEAFHAWNRTAQEQGVADMYRLAVSDSHSDDSNESNCWWRHPATGDLAIFASPPDLVRHTNRLPIIGSLPPGTALQGLEIYTLGVTNSTHDDNAPDSRAQRKSRGTVKLLPVPGQNKVFPWNRKAATRGEILLLKFKITDASSYHEEDAENPPVTEGYVVYSIDGYAFLQPGSVPDYVTHYADPHCWYWKVTGSRGATVNSVTSDDANRRRSEDTVHIPYGSIVMVVKQRLGENQQPMLYVVTRLWDTATRAYTPVQGWCTAANALQPLPLARPVLYQVTFPVGHLVTEALALDSELRFHAVQGAPLTVIDKAFYIRPGRKTAKERMHAAGCGWFSPWASSKFEGKAAVAFPEGCDATFDPREPGVFHYLFQRVYLLKECHRDYEEIDHITTPASVTTSEPASSTDSTEYPDDSTDNLLQTNEGVARAEPSVVEPDQGPEDSCPSQNTEGAVVHVERSDAPPDACQDEVVNSPIRMDSFSDARETTPAPLHVDEDDALYRERLVVAPEVDVDGRTLSSHCVVCQRCDVEASLAQYQHVSGGACNVAVCQECFEDYEVGTECPTCPETTGKAIRLDGMPQ